MTDTELLGRLRPIEDHELKMMLEWRNTPEVRNNMYTTDIIPLDDHLQWWERIKKDDSVHYFFYEYDNIPQGVVYFTQIDVLNHQAMWGFYASPNALRGTGSRMEVLALDYAFDKLNLHKLSCEVLDYNLAVVKFHKKFGFVEEGYFREHHLCKNQYFGIYRLALISEEWRQSKNDIFRRIVAFQVK